MDARGRFVFLALGLAIGAVVGGGVTWIVGSQIRDRVEREQATERMSVFESDRRTRIERGWRSVRADAMTPEQMKAALSRCDADVRDTPERVGRELANRQ